MNLYEILVPTEMVRDGKTVPIKTRYHRVWDERVRAIAGGITVLTPAKGQWVSPTGQFFSEKMIPVRIACSPDEMREISDMTAGYYNQQAILYVNLGEVVIKHYG